MGKKLQDAIDSIKKQHGAGAIMRLGSGEKLSIDVIPSGSLAIDYALGVGGFPRGRIIEIYGTESGGKTTLTLHVIAQAQKLGGVAAFIDAEHAFDPTYAKAIGVNVENLLISQPDCGEQALEIVESLIRSEEVDIVVVDSVAALTPRAEIEGEMGQAQMGLQARLMSQALRKLTAITSKSKTCLIFINQVRDKIGIMFGCVHGDTLINFTDGRSIPIKQVVDKKISGNVWSYLDGKFVSRKIINWHNNGKNPHSENWTHIECDSIGTGGGTLGLTITLNHEILTTRGWVEAKNLNPSDELISKYRSIINGSLADFLQGVFVGDSTLAVRHKNTASLKFQDSSNHEYLKWKISKLKDAFSFTKTTARYTSEFSYELAKIKRMLGRREPIRFFDRYTPMGLAVWIMDDGHYDENHKRYSLSVKRIKNDRTKLDSVVRAFKEIGLDCSHTSGGTIIFSVYASQEIANRIKFYVPDCMYYKLPVILRGLYAANFSLSFVEKYLEEKSPIKTIRFASKRQMRQPTKYDLTIEGTHNYMVGGIKNGVVIHNSPETTTGGKALKFYASIRLDIRRGQTVKDGDDKTGNLTKIKIVKNKLAAPFKECEVEIVFGEGISAEKDLLTLGVEYGILEKSGVWYSLQGARIGQGSENARNYLKEHPEVRDKIDKILRDKLFSEKK